MALETEHRLLLGVEIKKKLKEFSLELSDLRAVERA